MPPAGTGAFGDSLESAASARPDFVAMLARLARMDSPQPARMEAAAASRVKALARFGSRFMPDRYLADAEIVADT